MPSASLEVERFANAADFLRDVGPWLLASEADNSVLLSIVQLLAGSDHPFQEPFYLAAVKSAGRIVGCAVRPPPDQLDLTPLPPGAAELLIGGVGEMYPQLDMVAGPPDSAEEFAKVWTRERGGQWRVRYNWTLLAVRTVRPPAAAPGRLRLAEETDLAIVREWARAYARETNAHIDVTAFYERRVRKQSLYLWDDAGAKCMVAEANKTPNSVSISGVYTPDAFRNRGYASNAVASATQRALDRGCKFCALFADRELATPMRIYRSVGYRPLRDHLYIDLVR
jgi:GNAT superfamily N-acetyltransferase